MNFRTMAVIAAATAAQLPQVNIDPNSEAVMAQAGLQKAEPCYCHDNYMGNLFYRNDLVGNKIYLFGAEKGKDYSFFAEIGGDEERIIHVMNGVSAVKYSVEDLVDASSEKVLFLNFATFEEKTFLYIRTAGGDGQFFSYLYQIARGELKYYCKSRFSWDAIDF